MRFAIYRDAAENGLRRVFIELYLSAGMEAPVIRARCFNWPLFILRPVLKLKKARMKREAALYYALSGEA